MLGTNRQLLVLVGGPGSGKTTIADHLVEHHRFTYFSVSEVARTIALGFDVDIHDFEALHAFADQYRARKARGAFAKITLEIMNTRSWTQAVLDGVRSPNALGVIREFATANGWQIQSLGVETPIAVARQRVEMRQRDRDPRSPTAILAYLQDARELARAGLQECDFVLTNDGGLDALIQRVEDLKLFAEGATA